MGFQNNRLTRIHFSLLLVSIVAFLFLYAVDTNLGGLRPIIYPIINPEYQFETLTERQVTICILPNANKNSLKLKGLAHPLFGCLSSSCTHPIEQSASAQVNDKEHTIVIQTKFVIQKDPGICTADCGGAGDIFAEFELPVLNAREYQVTLGTTALGVLKLPLSVPWCYASTSEHGVSQVTPDWVSFPTATPLPVVTPFIFPRAGYPPPVTIVPTLPDKGYPPLLPTGTHSYPPPKP